MITCHNVFNVWPKTTLLPVGPRDAKRLDVPVRVSWRSLLSQKLIYLEMWCCSQTLNLYSQSEVGNSAVNESVDGL